MAETDYSLISVYNKYYSIAKCKYKTLKSEDVFGIERVDNVETNSGAVACSVIELMYYTYNDDSGFFVGPHYDVFGPYSDNKYVLIGVDTLGEMSTLQKNWNGEFYINDFNVSSYIKSKQDIFKLEDFLGFPYNNFNKLIFFDKTKNGLNFIDDLVAVPFYTSSVSRSGGITGAKFLSQHLGKIFVGYQKPIKDFDRSFEDAVDRAKTVFQILTKYDYDKVTEQEKRILFDLRTNTVTMLGDYFVREDGLFSKMLETKYNIFLQDLNRARYDVLKRGYGKLLLNKDYRDVLIYVNKFNKLANNGSLSELIEFCKTEPKKLVDNMETRRQQKEIAKEIKNRKEQQKLQEEQKKAEKAEKEKMKRQYKL